MFQIIILDADKLREFYENVQSGFRKSPLEYILFTILIGLLLFAVLFFILSQIRAGRRVRKRTRERFRAILHKRGITPAQEKLIQRLTRYFPRDKKYLTDMLTHAHTFTTCVNRMSAREGVDDAEIAKLRIQLGFSGGEVTRGRGKPHQLHSTAEFPKGSLVKVNLPKQGTEKGRIDEVDELGLGITTRAAASPGSAVTLEVDSRSGYYLVRSQVIESGNNRIKVAHSEHLERVQNRNFYRKQTRLPITLKLPGNTGKIFHSYTLDLGGGGARVRDPGIQAFPGLELVMMIKTETGETLVLPVRVTRVAQKNNSISLTFGPIKEAVRDKIMRMVLP
ncbi:MAG: PilZ domain-containing protein [Spirochaetia bacterium]